jgi:hypothetical protein
MTRRRDSIARGSPSLLSWGISSLKPRWFRAFIFFMWRQNVPPKHRFLPEYTASSYPRRQHNQSFFRSEYLTLQGANRPKAHVLRHTVVHKYKYSSICHITDSNTPYSSSGVTGSHIYWVAHEIINRIIYIMLTVIRLLNRHGLPSCKPFKYQQHLRFNEVWQYNSQKGWSMSLGFSVKQTHVPNHVRTCKIWGFHGSDYEEWCLLGCYAVWLL